MGSGIFFLLSNWQLAVSVALGLLALGLVSVMLRNFWFAVAGLAVLIGYFAYQDAWERGAEACRQRVAEAVGAEQDRQRAISDQALEDARRLAAERALKAQALQSKVDEYESADDCILEPDRARGLHNIR
ncbi:MAG TPA: hypothetical protein VNZ94_01655 [Xanthobacteraceae bacterium]|nr:hypothetical protein [Xanthobacteraceae bacterium]